jgi:hypothetical protein
MYASRRCLEEKQAFSSPLETSYFKQPPHISMSGFFARCSFESMSSRTMMPVSVSQSPSASFRIVMVHSLFSGSSFSASSEELCFRISARLSIVSSRFDRGTPSAAQDVFRIVSTNCGLLNMPCNGSGANDGWAERRKMRRRKSGIAVVLKSALLFIVFCDEPLT